ncbi:hypothetical protein LNQ03_25840 [Klebsiella pneumoniae subsp. pneumoniae]|nr:hypothetical protein [Klebsiella pneumoniae subsp. pneumoniae]
MVLNDQGEGTVTLPIGDFNGELRVMAQAWTADDFGSSEDKVVVAAPVIAETGTLRASSPAAIPHGWRWISAI